jgi:hypothetical protein
VNRICSLSGAQRIKLKVAAKGAVEYAVQDWIDSVGQQFGVQFGAAPQPAGVIAPAPAAGVGRRGGRGGVAAAQPMPVAVDVAVAQPAPFQGEVAARNAAVMQAELAQRQAMLQQQLAQAGNQNPAQAAQLVAQVQALQQAQVQAAQQVVAQRFTNVVEEVVVNDNGVNRVVRRVRRVPVPQTAAAAVAEQQHVWSSALENTLTPEQRKLLEESQAQRVANRAVNTPSARLVDQIDQWLLLDPTQREKVTELVNQTLDLAAIRVQVQRTPQLTPAIIDRVVKRMPAADMTAMLSPMQLTRWQQAVQSQMPVAAQGEFIGIEQIQLMPAAEGAVPAAPFRAR